MDRKERKFIYKNTPTPMGVYQIRNTANDKVLVGGSLNLDGRRNRFNFELAQGTTSTDREMKRDWERFGASSFVFEVLEQLKPVDDPRHDYKADLADLEKKWLDKLQPYGDRGYNKKQD